MIAAQWWHRHRGYFPESVEVEYDREPERAVSRIVRQLWNDQGRDRRDRQRDATEVYYGSDWSSDEETAGTLRAYGVQPDPAGYNVIQSITDTSVSRLVQNRVRPLILTEDGNAQQQEQSRALQRVVEGTFWDAGVYGELGEHVCYDGHLFDAGGIKVYPDYAGMRLCLDRIDPCRFMVSRRESELGNPRSAYYYEAVDRGELLAMFRDADADVVRAIEDAASAPHDLKSSAADEFTDDVEVFEAWHLPSSRVDRDDPRAWGYNDNGEYDADVDPGHDGFRVLCIDGTTLIAEPWPFPYYPVSWFKPLQKRRSYWSRSVPETIAGAQLLINRMNSRVDRIMHLHSRPMIAVWRNAKLNTAKVTNGLASILEVSVPPSQAIHYITPQSVPAEYLNRIDAIASWAERQWGVNDMALTGSKPAGINHEPGMRHLSDELSARHAAKGHAWERCHQHLAQLVVDGHRMLADHARRNGQDYKVVFGGDRELEQIDWKRADLGAAVYRVKVWPTNLLPQTPAAKANTLMDWMQAGLITAQQALTMLDHPDVESVQGDAAAMRKNVDAKIAKLLSGAPFEEAMPHPYMDLGLCVTVCSSRLNELEAKGYDDATLDKLRQFYEAAKELQRKAEPAQQPTPQGPPPGPAAPPDAPPMAA